MNSKGNNEKYLLERLRRGDEDAFEEVYNQFHGELLRIIMSLVGDQQEAEDIVAEVFLVLDQLRYNMENIYNVKGFLFISARNKSLSCLRKKKVADKAKDYLERMMHNNTDDEWWADVEKDQVLRLIHQEMASLPSAYAEVIRALFYEELTPREASTKMNLAYQTILNYKNNALRIMRDRLRKKGIL